MTKYAEEVKNHARARWKAGDSLTQIVADLGAPKATVYKWLVKIPRGVEADKAAQLVQLARDATPKEGTATPVSEPDWVDIDRVANGLIYGYTQALASVTRLVGTGEGSDWLKNQNARDLAYLSDRFSGNLIRLLTAIRVGGDADADSNAPS